MPRRLCNKLSKSHAMIGVMSIGPSVGINLRSGATIHSVKMYDHRTHPEWRRDRQPRRNDSHQQRQAKQRKRPGGQQDRQRSRRMGHVRHLSEHAAEKIRRSQAGCPAAHSRRSSKAARTMERRRPAPSPIRRHHKRIDPRPGESRRRLNGLTRRVRDGPLRRQARTTRAPRASKDHLHDDDDAIETACHVHARKLDVACGRSKPHSAVGARRCRPHLLLTGSDTRPSRPGSFRATARSIDLIKRWPRKLAASTGVDQDPNALPNKEANGSSPEWMPTQGMSNRHHHQHGRAGARARPGEAMSRRGCSRCSRRIGRSTR